MLHLQVLGLLRRQRFVVLSLPAQASQRPRRSGLRSHPVDVLIFNRVMQKAGNDEVRILSSGRIRDKGGHFEEMVDVRRALALRLLVRVPTGRHLGSFEHSDARIDHEVP